jgi:hypothetical protein
MPISNYTTKVDSMNSVAEIQKILMNHDADKIMVELADRLPVALTFQVKTAKGNISFRLPSNWEGVLRALIKDSSVSKASKTKEQALRVSWRILRDWVEAQMAMIEAELTSVDQVFLPYALTKTGKTVYEDFNTDNFLKLDR